jgi:competence protein ComGC
MVARVLMVLLMLLFVGCGKTSPGSGSAEDSAKIGPVLEQLTQAVRKYAVEQHRAPTLLDELVAKGYLAEIPSAPAGKKFAINKNLQVILAKQ